MCRHRISLVQSLGEEESFEGLQSLGLFLVEVSDVCNTVTRREAVYQ